MLELEWDDDILIALSWIMHCTARRSSHGHTATAPALQHSNPLRSDGCPLRAGVASVVHLRAQSEALGINGETERRQGLVLTVALASSGEEPRQSGQ
jgi:hypothetical protein